MSDHGGPHARQSDGSATRVGRYLRRAMDDPMRITADLSIPLTEIDLRVSRSSGPGGQHANVTASRVEAVFDVAGSPSLSPDQRRRIAARLGATARAVAQDTRSQTRNRELALQRLRDRLARAVAVQRPRHRTKPGRAARERRLGAKRRRSEIKRRRRPPPEDRT